MPHATASSDAEASSIATVDELNHVEFTGTLKLPPELQTLRDGTPRARLRVAIRARTPAVLSPKPRTIDVTTLVYGERARVVCERLHTGARVEVDGRLDYVEWPADGGPPRSELRVVAHKVEVMDAPGGPPEPTVTQSADDDGPAPAPTPPAPPIDDAERGVLAEFGLVP